MNDKYISLREHNYGVRIAVLEERARGADKALEVRTRYLERRLADLNGEAGRLKTVLDNSVPLTIFNAYVSSQRDKDDAKDKNERDTFDAYVQSQARKQEEYQRTQYDAFKLYSDEMAKWRASINVRLAGWAGALAVIIAVLQYVFRQ